MSFVLYPMVNTWAPHFMNRIQHQLAMREPRMREKWMTSDGVSSLAPCGNTWGMKTADCSALSENHSCISIGHGITCRYFTVCQDIWPRHTCGFDPPKKIAGTLRLCGSIPPGPMVCPASQIYQPSWKFAQYCANTIIIRNLWVCSGIVLLTSIPLIYSGIALLTSIPLIVYFCYHSMDKISAYHINIDMCLLLLIYNDIPISNIQYISNSLTIIAWM